MVKKRSMLTKFITEIMCLMHIIVYVNARILERVDPILWRPTNKLVYGKRVEFKIVIMWINPCKEFDDHSNAHPHHDAKRQCYELFNSEWITKIKSLGKMHPVSKSRQIGLLLGITVVGYQIITNLVSRVADAVSPNAAESTLLVTSRIAEYSRTQSAIKDIVTKMMSNMEIMDSNLHKLKKTYDEEWSDYHNQVFSIIGVLNEINRIGVRLDNIIGKARQGLVDTREVAYFMGMNEIKHVNIHDLDIDLLSISPEYTEFISAHEVDNGRGIHIHFAVIIEYPGAKIYEIDSFDYWDVVKSPPILMKYIGKPYVLFDKSHNCRRAVIDSKAMLISERCSKPDYIDPSLNQWTKSSQQYNTSALEPQVKVTKFYNYVYCFPENITLHGHSQYCPPSVFKLPVDISFKIGELEVEAVTIVLNITKKDLVLENFHYNEMDNPSVNERKLIQNQWNLTEQLKNLENLNTQINYQNPYSFQWYWIVFSLVTYTGICLVGYFSYVHFNLQPAVKEVVELNTIGRCSICEKRKVKRSKHNAVKISESIYPAV